MHVFWVMLQYDLFGWCCYKNFVYVFLFFRVLIYVNVELVHRYTNHPFYIYSVFGTSFFGSSTFCGSSWTSMVPVIELPDFHIARWCNIALYFSFFFVIFNFLIWVLVCSVATMGLFPNMHAYLTYFFVTRLHTSNSGRTSVCV